MNEHTEVLIRELAAKMGTTVEYLWEVLVRQAYITGSVNIFFALFMLSAVAAALLVAHKMTKKWKDSSDRAMVFLVIITVGLFFSIGATILLYEGIIALANPEYWALMQVLP
jgi:hypothetical protein